LAKGVAKNHKRCVVNVNEIYEWNIQNNTAAGKQA
jgi:hypothetical protein